VCTRYISPEAGDIERLWHVGARTPASWPRELFPRYRGPFVRAARQAAVPQREFVVGQWALVPWFATTPTLPYLTVNARFEEIAAKASYKLPWARGQRCIIPAEGFFEPNWESGRHVPWRFRRADGRPWGLAGLWNTWVDKASGEIVESYTMLTLNADAHPLMRRMHKPDPKRPADAQDKRSVVPIEPEDVDTWLFAPLPEAAALVKLAPERLFDAAPALPPDPATPVTPATLELPPA
jgi:putative SOS response-associated peptidase YedK